MYAGGDGVALGYLNRPEATAERFVADPFVPGGVLYRTGDVVRWNSDGLLEFLGRYDAQVKLRGFRIEPGEIEVALRCLPGVRDAVAMLREDCPGERRIVAYLVAAGEVISWPPAALRKALSPLLPDYMLPSSFVWVDRIPLKSNGKVDVKALPVPELPAVAPPGKELANPLEQELLGIWRRNFGRDDIGLKDNFFSLGGHSLLAARLGTEIGRELGCRLPLASLFQSPTVELLARRLSGMAEEVEWESLVPLRPQGHKPPLFFAHGYGGDVLGFAYVARALPADQPAYGLQAVGLDGRRPRHASVEEMGACYAREIAAFRPDGPLYLVGYSMGGLVALETARQLQAIGRSVELLAMLDSEPLCPIPWPCQAFALAGYLPARVLVHWRRSRQGAIGDRRLYWHGRWKAVLSLLSGVFSGRPPPSAVPPPAPASPPTAVCFTDDYYVRLAAAYQVSPYTGTVDVISTDDLNSRWRWWFWWLYVKGGIHHHRLSEVGHLQLIEPDQAQAVADVLLKALERAQKSVREEEGA